MGSDDITITTIGLNRKTSDLLDVDFIQGKGWCCCIRDVPDVGNIINVGCSYGTVDECIVARDMEVLKSFGRTNTSHKLLNKQYNIKYSPDLEPNDSFEMELMPYVWIVVNPTLMSDKLLTRSLHETYGDRCSKEFKESVSLTTRASGYLNEHKSWAETITTGYMPMANFVFEISFSHQNSLGLHLKSHFVPYGQSDCHEMGCLMVVGVHSPVLARHNVVRPGDIMLTVNETSLVNTVANRNPDEPSIPGTFSFEFATRLISTAKHPRVIRFLRLASVCAYNDSTKLSPSELIAYASSSYPHTSAKYTASASAIQLTYLHPQCPYVIKKMVQGGAISWRMLPGGDSAAQPPAGPGGLIHGAVLLNSLGSMETGGEGSGTGSLRSATATATRGNIGEGAYDRVPVGVYRELSLNKSSSSTNYPGVGGKQTQGVKFVAQIQVPPPCALITSKATKSTVDTAAAAAAPTAAGPFYYIGTYDSEEEATAAYTLAVKEVITTGSFTMKSAAPNVPPPRTSSSSSNIISSSGSSSSGSSSSSAATGASASYYAAGTSAGQAVGTKRSFDGASTTGSNMPTKPVSGSSYWAAQAAATNTTATAVATGPPVVAKLPSLSSRGSVGPMVLPAQAHLQTPLPPPIPPQSK